MSFVVSEKKADFAIAPLRKIATCLNE